ncbi:MAG: 50S ribosomal protein L7/L12 [Candidatus Dormibacteraceae bacterium]
MATAEKLSPKDFVEALKGWTVLEVVEAVKMIEDEFGIKAAAAVAAPAAGGAAPAAAAEEAVEEQTEFTVTLTAIGDSKINVIKAVREITGLGLKEAKDLVDASPKAVKENVNKEEADSIAAKLKEAGATAEVK